MNYALCPSNQFVRLLRKILKGTPALAADIQEALLLLSQNPRDPRLRTHKLKAIFIIPGRAKRAMI